MPAVTGITAERRTLAEAVRAAILTVHAAAGLASCADPQTQRLLRASEGLSRSALAVLLAAPPAATSPHQPRATRPDDAPRRRRRPRGKRGDRGPTATAMDEDVAATPEPSGDARASGLAAAPGVPRRALVASGEPETRLLSNATGTVTSGLTLEQCKAEMSGTSPPWQKRQRSEGTQRGVQRDNAVHEGVHSDLGDKWADTPGASLCASPELLQLCGGTGPAVVAPPANLGNPPASEPAVLQQRQTEVLELYRELRGRDPDLDKVFAYFAESCVFSGRFVEAPKWRVLLEHLLVWKTMGLDYLRCNKLSDLLEPRLGKLAEAERTSSS
jgi:hypothetical protein